MRRYTIIFVCVILLIINVFIEFSHKHKEEIKGVMIEPEYDLIIGVKEGVDFQVVENAIETYTNNYSVDFSQNDKIKRVFLDSNSSRLLVKGFLEKSGLVDYVEFNAPIFINLTPNDPYYTDNNLEVSKLWNLPRVEASQAWDVSTGSDIIVAVLDTGLDYNHEDIVKNVWVNIEEIDGFADNRYDFSHGVIDTNANSIIDCQDLFNSANNSARDGLDTDNNGYIDDVCGWDFQNNDNNPIDDHGHGSHVAGIIGGMGNNSTGITGANWGIQIMPMKVLNSAGSGSYYSAIDALSYTKNNGAVVANMSWSGYSYLQSLQNALDDVYSSGIISVVSAGNDNIDTNNNFPAGMEHVLTVAATNSSDQKASFSDYGYKVEISAPGTTILSLRASGTSGCTGHVNTKYGYCGGTSMSAPLVAGGAALVLGYNPALANYQVMQILQENTDYISSSSYIGRGRLNLNDAMHNTTIGATKTSAFSSTIELSSSNIEIGNPITATVTIRNGNNAPLSGKTITLGTSRGAQDTVSPSSQVTNVNGEVEFTINSSISGSFYITARDITGGDNIVIANQPSVTFTATLDHFDISSIQNQRTGISFQIIVTAKNQNDYTIGNYMETVGFSDISGSVSPSTSTYFINGQWSGNITVQNYQINDTLTVTKNGKSGVSNAFSVYHPDAFIASVNPVVMPNSGGKTSGNIVISGQNFRTNMTITYSKQGYTSFGCSSIVINSDSTATCSINFTEKALKGWNITALNTGINTNPYVKNSGIAVVRGSDTNGDYQVGVLDFSLLLSSWNKVGVFASDINNDGRVNIYDFSFMLGEWGRY